MIKPNQIITLTLKVGIQSIDGDDLSSDFVSYFTTEMTPLYASVNDIRRRIGAHTTDIIDDVINQINLVHTNAAIAATSCDTTNSTWRFHANRWITAMTSLVLLDNNEAFSGAATGGVSKVLGDFEMSKKGATSSSGGINDLIERLECELFKLEPAVRDCALPRTNCTAMDDPRLAAADYNPLVPRYFIRGDCDVNYPVVGRRWLKQDLPIATDKTKIFSRWYKTRYWPL